MGVELGDYNVETIGAVVRTETSDGTGSAGDAVTIDANGKVTQYSTDGADFYGVLAQDSPADGEDVSVIIHGDAIVNAGGSITRGDLIELPGTTNGRVAQNTEGTEKDVDEGATNTYTLAIQTAKALTDSGGSTSAGESLGTNEAVIWIP